MNRLSTFILMAATIGPLPLFGQQGEIGRDIDNIDDIRIPYSQDMIVAASTTTFWDDISSLPASGTVGAVMTLPYSKHARDSTSDSLSGYEVLSGVFEAHISDSGLVGAVIAIEDSSSGWVELSWNLHWDAPHMEIRSAGWEKKITITPVLIPSSTYEAQSLYRDKGSKLLAELEKVSLLASILNQPEISQKLPGQLAVNLVRAIDPRQSMPASSSPSDFESGWMCAVSCTGLVVSSGITVVSGGTLSPAAYFGAAACGSCMGFTWGAAPVEQEHIHLPSGGSYAIGSFLPPLPPGWVWTCYPSGGGYVCEPEQKNISYDPC